MTKYLGIEIDYSRDNTIPEKGLEMLTKNGFYKKPNEDSPQESFARAATCFSFGDYELAQRVYDGISKRWGMYASPVLSNAVDVNWPVFTKEQFELAGDWLECNVKPDGLPISCFLVKIPDTKEGLVAASAEAKWLSMMGGGIGIYSANRSPDEKSTGVMAHLKGYDADTLAYKQTASRRGSIGAYLDIDHPEIHTFLQMRNPVGGDMNKKCFNLNNAVNINDKFMNAVINGEKYELIDPKHGNTGSFLDAREVWEDILKLRYETGEPYLNFVDTVNRNLPKQIKNPLYKVVQSNLCVAPETLILTRQGYEAIESLEGETVDVWNGFEWSETTVFKTGENQKLLTVKTNSGFELDCTPYHKFYVAMRNPSSGNRWVVEKRASELCIGDKLIKLNLPLISGNETLDNAYANGFYSGDGCLTKAGKRIYLYGDKRKLKPHFGEIFKTWYVQDNYDREYGESLYLKDKFFVPTCDYDVDSRVVWFAGLCDSDGTVARNGNTQSIQVASINKEFLLQTQMMLQTLGINSKVTKMVDAGLRLLPLNDGSGELGLFPCKESYRLLLGQTCINQLQALGFKPNRLKLTDHVPNRECSQFVKIVSVEDSGRFDDTYCFTEPKRGMGVFNGILTGNCNEIHLMTSDRRTAVCCLSSLNLDTYDEWKDTTWVSDMTRFLDNVLEYFIRLAPKDKLQRAIYSAKKERALGLGTLGYHSYLQRKNIAFESQEAASATYYLYKSIKEQAEKASMQLAVERGESPDCVGSGFRNSHLCVSGDTRILTKQGQKEIKSLVGKDIEIWNGEEWSNTKPFETGVSRLLKVCFSNGMELKCTPDHRFLIATPKRDTSELGGLKLIDVEAQMLRVGDCLPKFFTAPSDCGVDLEYPYESGLFCGDGSISNAKAGKYPRKELRLYGDKMRLENDIKWKSSNTWGGEDCVRGYLPDSCLEKYVVPFGYSIASKTLWLCGLIDADGSSNSKGVSISMASKDFATRVALLVQELGGDINVTETQRTGGFSTQNTKHYVVGISLHSCNKIFKVITPKRVKVSVSGATHQQIGSYHMTEVTSVEYLQESEMTYCFTESKKGTGIFNGLLTKQCAIAPNASSADLLGVSPSREPLAGNGYNSQGRAGSFLIKNEHLVNLLQAKGYNDSATWSSIIKNNGSVSHLDFLTDHEKNVYKAGKEINPMWIVELAAIAQEHICQGQSINIQVPNTITKQEMSDIHILAWKKGLKGLYYCRTEAAEKVDVGTGGDKPLNSVPVKFKIEYQECLSCSG